MPYRTRRERRYRRKNAKAVALSAHSTGGWGKDSPVQRGDLLLVLKAIRQRWPTSAATRQAIVDRMFQMFDEAKASDDARLSTSICRVVIAMEGDNQRRLFEELDRLGADWPTDVPRAT